MNSIRFAFHGHSNLFFFFGSSYCLQYTFQNNHLDSSGSPLLLCCRPCRLGQTPPKEQKVLAPHLPRWAFQTSTALQPLPGPWTAMLRGGHGSWKTFFWWSHWCCHVPDSLPIMVSLFYEPSSGHREGWWESCTISRITGLGLPSSIFGPILCS